MNQQGKQSSANKTGKINEKEMKTAQGKLNQSAEDVQTEHIEDQVRPADMKEAGSDQPLVVLVKENPVYFKFIPIEKKAVWKAFVGDDGGYDNKDQ